jgi:hypothetical protein
MAGEGEDAQTEQVMEALVKARGVGVCSVMRV